jgi:signal transduction histidine kinase/HD-like signal output (HDOD) protein
MTVTPRQDDGAPSIGPLPALGAVARRWLALHSVEDPGLDDALSVLESDPVLAGPVLAWCRVRAGVSAPRVTTGHRALVLLGLPAVRGAVVGVSSIVTLTPRDGTPSAVDLEGFWTHALGVSAMCEHLANTVDGIDPDNAALAGLLHDAGKLALAHDMPAPFEQAVAMNERLGRGLGFCLRDTIGMDHHTAGKRLAEAWKLPAAVRDALWLHNQPLAAMPASADRRMAGLVSLAKAWAQRTRLGWSGESDAGGRGGGPDDLRPLCVAVGVDPLRLEACVGPVLAEVRARASAIGLSKGGARLGTERRRNGDGVSDNEPGPLAVDPIAWSAAEASRRSNELAARLHEIERDSARARAVLGAIASFRASVRLDDEPISVVGAIGRSACELMGVGRVAVVWQSAEREPWALALVGAQGVPERARPVESPRDGAEVRRPAELARAHASQVLVACELGWLAKLIEHLREAGTPALIGAGATGDTPGASCLVLAPVPRLSIQEDTTEPVAGVWAWALEASSRAAAARTLGEELSQTNRALASTRDELASKESMVRLGQMAAGAAHELNNPLTVIRGRAQLIRERASTPKQREDAVAIAEAAQQVSDMVTSLHLLSNPPQLKPAACDPMLVLRDAIDRARGRVPLAAQKTRVRVNGDGATASMRLDAELAAQALCEPIANAMLAKPGGEVHISIESEAFSDRLLVRIMDRGRGLSVRSLTHAFDPFFSEQAAGRRAGLGLSRARSLIELMGGSIELANNPSDVGGAYAEIVLPQAAEWKRAA